MERLGLDRLGLDRLGLDRLGLEGSTSRYRLGLESLQKRNILVSFRS